MCTRGGTIKQTKRQRDNASRYASFRLQYENDYEYEFSVLSTRSRFEWRKMSKCGCSELKTRTRSRPPI